MMGKKEKSYRAYTANQKQAINDALNILDRPKNEHAKWRQRITKATQTYRRPQLRKEASVTTARKQLKTLKDRLSDASEVLGDLDPIANAHLFSKENMDVGLMHQDAKWHQGYFAEFARLCGNLIANGGLTVKRYDADSIENERKASFVAAALLVYCDAKGKPPTATYGRQVMSFLQDVGYAAGIPANSATGEISFDKFVKKHIPPGTDLNEYLSERHLFHK